MRKLDQLDGSDRRSPLSTPTREEVARPEHLTIRNHVALLVSTAKRDGDVERATDRIIALFAREALSLPLLSENNDLKGRAVNDGLPATTATPIGNDARAPCVGEGWRCDGTWHRGWDGHDPYCERCPNPTGAA